MRPSSKSRINAEAMELQTYRRSASPTFYRLLSREQATTTFRSELPSDRAAGRVFAELGSNLRKRDLGGFCSDIDALCTLAVISFGAAI
jgi:hypothetical protein